MSYDWSQNVRLKHIDESKIPVQEDKILEFLRKTARVKDIYQEVLHQKIIAQAVQARGFNRYAFRRRME